jgi:mRNA interferase MazF
LVETFGGESVATFKKGEIILLPYPFTNLSGFKIRPAIIIKNLSQDYLVMQITSQSSYLESVKLEQSDFEKGSIMTHSYVRPEKLFIVHESKIIRKIALVRTSKVNEIIAKLIEILQSED